MDCLSCSRCNLSWGREQAVAIYTCRNGNRAALCETCLSVWLRNAAADLGLAPKKLEFLENR